MRLLRLKSSGEYSLTSDLIHNIPPYAILSHTWGEDDEEVTFRDVVQGVGESKVGYDKIRFCGKQAQRHGLQYFWVDTCCIDKSNNFELQEAINSMFRWYRNAAKCYVYLSDVSITKQSASTQVSGFNWETAFRASKWFTRGWTLQELLAPRSVEFFSQEGQLLGDKESLEQYLHEITGISALALQGAPLSQFSVDERLSWAESRQTTREEDSAYSLLGIFKIYMPLIYGEGREIAFMRLRKEIDKPVNALHSRLPSAADASFNSYQKQHDPTCLENTRVDLLREIYKWAEGGDDRCIFWLNGLAGTGKSTIARTVSQKYFYQKRLGASFFFSRGGEDVGDATKFVTSIALQLASSIPGAAQHICDAAMERTDLTSLSLRGQWRQLILRPLSRLDSGSFPSSYVIIVDALDECDSEDDIRIILQLFSETRTLKTVRLRVFLTSRPEIPIRYFSNYTLEDIYQNFMLHSIKRNIVNHDISIFVEYNLEVIRRECSLEASWPGTEAIKRLVQNANGLFIWAATACRFIREGRKQQVIKNRLSSILQINSSITEPEEQLNKIYITVLRQSIPLKFSNEEKEEFLSKLKSVLGSIVVLLSPLPIRSLSTLLYMLEDDVDNTIEHLHALLDISKDQFRPMYLYHHSFQDFLLDKDRCTDSNFWVDKKQAHQTLANSCIQLMSNSLRQDVCGQQVPSTLVDNVEYSQIEECLPLEVKYACLYWIQHLQASGSQLYDNDHVHQFLERHLLHWLEALGWIGKSFEGIRAICSLETQIQADQNPSLYTFIREAKRFALYNRLVIKQTPLQLYYLALLSAPENSIIRRQFNAYTLPWVYTKTKVQRNWSAALQTLEGYSGSVRGVVISPDGQQIASGSDDSIVRLWDTVTGAHLHTLEGHSGSIYSVAFSPDSMQLASASGDKTIRLWDAVTGELLRILNGHSDYINSVTFSPDGKQVASGSYDSTVRLWDAVTGVLLQTLKGHSDSVSSVSFSPDGKQVASGSYDSTVRLWDAVTGVSVQTLEGHTDYVNSVAFSPNFKQVVSGSDDKTVRLWDTVTGASLQILEGHSSLVLSVTFSPDGTKIASGSDDKTVRLWDAVIGALLQTLEGCLSFVSSVAFSPDGKHVVSGSYDSTVQIWNVLTGAPFKISNQSTRSGMRSSNEDGAWEASGIHSDSSSDAGSVLSVAASTSSRSSIAGEIEIIAGKEFSEMLLRDEELKLMFVLAVESDKIGSEKFKRNICRLLNHLSIELKEEAKIKEQNDVVYLIRSQSRVVARYICNSIAPSKYPNCFDRLQKQAYNKSSRLLAQQAVNQYLEHPHTIYGDKVSEGDSNVQDRPPVEEESESESDIDEEFENYEPLSGLSRVQEFVISSTAFSRFRENLRGFVRQDFMSQVNSLMRKLTRYPGLALSTSKLNRLVRELAFIPPNKIWMSFKESLDLSNQCKNMIEDLTQQTWEWWPLKPCRRPLSAGQARLFWNCPCGEVRWEDVPLPFATRFSKLLKQATNSLITQAPCSPPYSNSITYTKNSGVGVQLNSLDRHPLEPIQNQYRHTSYNNPRENLATSSETVIRTTPASKSLPTRYVLLGVTVGDDLRLAQIEVRGASHTTDDHFFKELRHQYTELRGLMRIWFSIYRYAHCQFVKFEKIGNNEIVLRDENSIPDPDDRTYEYIPKPIKHMPPITEHEFRRRFYACYYRCSMSKIMLLSAFHRCGRVCREAQVLDRIPKKNLRLEQNGDKREIFWGILAMEHISFLMVSIYHFLILVPGLIFWFLWLFYWDHSGDLQNASIPFLALLACLPLFWFPLVIKTK